MATRPRKRYRLGKKERERKRLREADHLTPEERASLTRRINPRLKNNAPE